MLTFLEIDVASVQDFKGCSSQINVFYTGLILSEITYEKFVGKE